MALKTRLKFIGFALVLGNLGVLSTLKAGPEIDTEKVKEKIKQSRALYDEFHGSYVSHGCPGYWRLPWWKKIFHPWQTYACRKLIKAFRYLETDMRENNILLEQAKEKTCRR